MLGPLRPPKGPGCARRRRRLSGSCALRRQRDQHVSFSANRAQHPARSGRVKGRSQPIDVCLVGLRLGAHRVVPDVSRQRFTGHDLSCVCREVEQQIEHGSPQVEWHAVAARAMRGRIDPQRPHGNRPFRTCARSGTRVCAREQHIQTGQRFARHAPAVRGSRRPRSRRARCALRR